MKFRRTAALALAAIATTTSLAACGRGASDEDTIKLGTTEADMGYWKVFEQEAEKAGVKIKTTQFADYNTPNRALSEGEVDANLFQHLKFLAAYNTGANDNLVPIGSTQIVPLALYWKGHTGLDGIEGQDIALPNDPSNQGRAINVLKQAGLVTLKSENLVTPTPADVDTAASKVKVVPVDSAQTATVYNEGKPAIVNNTFLERAKIDAKTAIFKDDPNSKEAEPYINAIVVKEKDVNNEKIAKLVDVYHSPEVQKALAEDSKGTSVEVKRSKEDLKAILDRLQNTK
ncbi:MetQ/NlpA family ABC transporter substrate-binding protein [Corynebacterium epidermidicanis]|uniref:ABC-type metal ion transport system, periplasmic component/surface antigen n=1 Tax=Corynebacterium epidermidicanis TaxID=1050174 RepID=A0A0G3GU61_9CORY|nr:MetQ/NlpA family ABC transporter substrate-binding protein [Corynebacterium epidermidicanis]AKK02402.1 ABC-type metal ion transport system, periplasmic component/surface antigen [Corynebacterium epidermidicanis]